MSGLFSVEAEQAVLGAALSSRTALADVVDILDPDDFHRPSHQVVFRAIVDLLVAGEQVDPVAVADQLQRAGRLDEAGGASGLHSLVASTLTAANAPYHARIVAGHARRRRLVDAARRLATAVKDPKVDVDAAVDEHIGRLASSNGTAPVMRAGDVRDQVLDRIVGAGPTPVAFMPGFERNALVLPGQLTVVTGTPSAGKSELVDAAVLHLARRYGWRWAVYSPEASPAPMWFEAMLHRLMGHRPDGNLVDGPVIDEHLEWMHGQFWWLDVEDGSLPRILAHARWLAREHALDGLLVDPWNKTTWSRLPDESTTEAIGRHLAEIVRFARREQVHVIVVAHPRKMDRDSRGRAKVPTAYDIAHTAEFYNQADLILSLSRGAEGGVACQVQKVKREPEWGRMGDVHLTFNQSARRYVPQSPV